MLSNFDDEERAKIVVISTCRGMEILKANGRDFLFATVETCVDFLASLIWSHPEPSGACRAGGNEPEAHSFHN